MRKRVDHDATQEVSSSQLVPDAKPPAFAGSKNDASMWMQAPVSADDFVGVPKKKAGTRGLVIGVFALLLVGVTAAGVYYAILRPPDLRPAASAGSTASNAPASTEAAPAQPAVAPALPDAGSEVATVSSDAGAGGDGDAGVGSAAALNADAVSAADPVIKKTPAKKRTTKKKTAKKKKMRSKKRR